MALMSEILPDLFAWYLLQLGKSAWLDLDEVEVAQHSIMAARRWRRRVAATYDRQVAIRRARERLALANQLVARMRRLARPCKRRDLARGFDNQRMDRLGPMIDSLVGLGVFTNTAGWLALDASGQHRGLDPNDFIEPLADIPFPITHRLAVAEERQAALAAAENETAAQTAAFETS
jgi:hypothetical protein